MAFSRPLFTCGSTVGMVANNSDVWAWLGTIARTPLNYTTFRSQFDKARKAAKVNFQFRDIRAKSATDTENLAHAQKLLGHKTRAMTEHYTRNRKGEKVRSVTRIKRGE